MPTLNYDRPISEAEYLKVEEAEPERHEYVAGCMFTMVGASMAHNRIVTNLVRYLFDPVDAAGCSLVSRSFCQKLCFDIV